jgi:hypothetical protein
MHQQPSVHIDVLQIQAPALGIVAQHRIQPRLLNIGKFTVAEA